jgi:hypothetical protein
MQAQKTPEIPRFSNTGASIGALLQSMLIRLLDMIGTRRAGIGRRETGRFLNFKYGRRLRVWRELKFENTAVMSERLPFDHINDLAVCLEMYGAKSIGSNDRSSTEDESVHS